MGAWVSKRPRWKLPVFVKVRSGNGIPSLPLYTIGQNKHRSAQSEGEDRKISTLYEKDVYESVALFNLPYHTQDIIEKLILKKWLICILDLYRSMKNYLWSNYFFTSCSSVEQVLSRADYH